MADPRIPFRTLRESVQSALREDILSNRFRPGQRLTEGELAIAYGVSRAPIREAVRALEEQGLLRAESNKGVVVTRLSPAELREVYEMRIALEPLAAGLAVPRLDDRTRDELHRQLEEMDATVEEPMLWLSLNNRFHSTLYAPSGRRRLCRLIDELTSMVEPFARIFLTMPGTLRESHNGHHVIVAAADRGDAEGCVVAVRDHLQGSSELIVRLAAQHELEG